MLPVQSVPEAWRVLAETCDQADRDRRSQTSWEGLEIKVKIKIYDENGAPLSDGKLFTVEVILSRRNVLTLAHKMDVPSSARTIFKSTAAGQIIVKVEDDTVHYGESRHGVMSPDTEAYIRDHGGRS